MLDHMDSVVEAASHAAKSSTIVAYITSGVATVFATATSSQIVDFLSLLCAVATFLISWHFKKLHYRLALQVFEMKARQAKEGQDVEPPTVQ